MTERIIEGLWDCPYCNTNTKGIWKGDNIKWLLIN